MKRKLAIGAGAALALATLGGAPAFAADHESTVSVLHAVPGLTVDVFINGEEAIPNFTPGTLTDPMMLAEGSYDIQVFADGGTPDTAEPAIEAMGLAVPGGADLTLVAHLTEAGEPALGAFANSTEPVAAGEARLTVRHLAAAPTVDVRADEGVVVEGLTNPEEATLVTAAGTVSADVVLTGTSDVAIGPADLPLTEGANTIVTAWGSAADGNLALAVQTVEAHSAPSGVPSGLGGATDQSALTALLAFAAALGLGIVAVRQQRIAKARG
ncbi:DUF4397 domain-containing protein [Agrococcus beijingensis]|uniref:DUF4397 domain-containing protein n=1 Tax=Agrococcus beijingensis TaxID=3068634 RepID=UPI0027404A00|nr:DUF4397 domain-containing protein [Agrococcus sp. REN33]